MKIVLLGFKSSLGLLETGYSKLSKISKKQKLFDAKALILYMSKRQNGQTEKHSFAL